MGKKKTVSVPSSWAFYEKLARDPAHQKAFKKVNVLIAKLIAKRGCARLKAKEK